MKVWFDITNTPQVHFLLAIERLLEKNLYQSIFTTRDFSETIKLLEQNIGNNFTVIGSHKGKNKIKKLIGIFSRLNDIRKKNIKFDVSVSCGSESAVWYARLTGKKSVAFGDNDLAKQWTYSWFMDFAFFPNAIPEDILTRQGIKKSKLYQYNGYKENIYIADYTPDSDFYSKIPFREYVVLRAENLNANYIKNDQQNSIVPELADLLIKKGLNIIFLPRYKSDNDLLQENEKIFIPSEPLNGLDLCYHASAVLTGAGTLAREAACLGTPSVSFFAGDRLLAVDKDLIKKNKMFFSRVPAEIITYLITSEKSEADLKSSVWVRDEVKFKLNEVLNNF
jgi:hypothetical protein